MNGGPVDASAGYTIEIKVDSQGAIGVCVEPAAEESAEESGGGESGDGSGDDMSDYQSVPNIREACKLVMKIFNSQGEMPDDGQDQAEMAAGYGKE